MNKLILFYGTPDKIVVPTYGKGEEKHDYGQGFTFAWRSWYSILY